MADSLKDKTAKGLFWGALNNGGMQLLNIIFGIVIARQLDPSDYGLIAMLVIYSSIAANLQDSGFMNALINRKNATQKDFNSIFWFNIILSVCIYVILWFCAPAIAEYNKQPMLIPLARYYFIGFVLASFSIIPRTYLMKDLRQKELAIVSLLSMLISGITGIIMALYGMAFWGLATQSILYVAFVSILSWYYVRWKPAFSFSFQPVREMFGFSCKILITNIVNNLNKFVFETFLGHFYPKNALGQYSQANNWNQKGNQIITGMVQGVAQPMFVGIRDESNGGDDEKERLCRAFRKMLRFTSFITFPAMFGLILIAPEFIEVTITDKYAESARLMQFLCFGGAFLPIAALYYNFIISRGKSDIYMWNMIIQFIFVAADLFIVQYFRLNWFGFSGMRLMILIYVSIIALWTLIWHWFVWREIRLSIWKAAIDMLPFLFIAAVTMTVTYFSTTFISNIYLLLASRIIMAAVLYMAVLWMLHANILRECINWLSRKEKRE